MKKNVPAVLVLVTISSKKQALLLANKILENRLAACVNILPQIDSLYWWKNRIEKTSEFLLIIKTTRKVFLRLKSFISDHHPYSVPEIIALPIQDGFNPYLNWIEAEVERGK